MKYATMMMVMFLMVGILFGGEPEMSEACKAAMKLPEVSAEFDAHTTAIDSVVKNYVKVLDAEDAKATKAGNLELIEAIKAEKEKINILSPGSSTTKWEKNKTLTTAQKSFNNGLGTAQKNYIAKLDGVLKKMVQAKKIDDAKIVKTFVEDLKMEEVKKMFVGDYELSNIRGKTISLKDDFTVEQGTEKGTWKIVAEDSIVVTLESGNINNVKLNMNARKYECVHKTPSGKTIDGLEYIRK